MNNMSHLIIISIIIYLPIKKKYVEELLVCYGSIELILAQLRIGVDTKYLDEVNHLFGFYFDADMAFHLTKLLLGEMQRL